MLNKEQQDFINKFNGLGSGVIGLYGAAGTGKTYTVNQLTGRVAYTAPTHKALSILADNVDKPEHCHTIQSFLGYGLETKNGKTKLVKTANSKYSSYDSLIIDEASMLGGQLCRDIRRIAEYIPVVVMGDCAQLPPVGEPRSVAFDMADNFVELTQQLRQDNAQNPLLELLADVRKSVFSGDFWQLSDFYQYANFYENTGVYVTGNQQQFDFWIKKSYERGDNNIAAIAYHNKRVDALNYKVNRHLHGENDYKVGQILVFNRPYKHDNSDYSNGETLTIEHIEQQNITLSIVKTRVSIPCYLINNSVLIAQNRDEYVAYCELIKQRIIAGTGGYRWADYYKLLDRLADISHCYAITAHKSQGSTYLNGFVDVRDILSSRQTVVDKNRCLYTAISRFKNNVVLLV